MFEFKSLHAYRIYPEKLWLQLHAHQVKSIHIYLHASYHILKNVIQQAFQSKLQWVLFQETSYETANFFQRITTIIELPDKSCDLSIKSFFRMFTLPKHDILR
jgi:hypothetical protein